MAITIKSETFQNLVGETAHDVDWLWRGYVAGGSVTLFISQWKTGKTTLLSVLLARLYDSRDLAGQAVRRARAALISEESRVHWQLRSKRLNLGPDALLYCRPFAGKPSYEEWVGLIDQLLQFKSHGGLDLVIIDTLATFLPSGAENQADALLHALRPLERLTAAGIAVLLVHHPRKGSVLAGQAARGSGALGGYVDILVEMNLFARQCREDRRRRLSAWSRHAETPSDLVIELNVDGKDYSVCDDVDEELLAILDIALRVIEERGEQMTRSMLRDHWPTRPRPGQTTLWKYLESGVQLGKIERNGAGHREDPFRYTLPGSDLPWVAGVDGIADELE